MSNADKLNRLIEKGMLANRRLSEKQIDSITRDIGRARLELNDLLTDYAKKDNTISKARISSLMRDLDEYETMIRKQAEKGMLDAIKQSVEAETRSINGAFKGVYGDLPQLDVNFGRINREAVDYVAKRFGEDGLVLSDRIWDYAAVKRTDIESIIRSGIIRSESVNALTQSVRKAYDNDYWKVRRLVLTETRTAQRASHSIYAQRSKVDINLRLLVGRAENPTHTCYPLANANSYGLGVGVYPPDKIPANPHPNCTSTIEYVVDESKLFT